MTARDEGGAVEFTTRVSAEGDGASLIGLVSADDLAKSPKLYITDTQDGAVEFKIDDHIICNLQCRTRVGYDSVLV